MAKKRKKYFAQNRHYDPKFHRAKHFTTLQEAITWIEEQGGGTVKKRNAGVIHGSGYGLGRVEFDPPLRVWGEVYVS